MADNGECDTCSQGSGANAGGKAMPLSVADAARDLWSREVTATPWPPSLRALQAGLAGQVVSAAIQPTALESSLSAPTATLERPSAPEAPATRPPGIEVTYLPAPWDQPVHQPTRANPTPIAERQWARAAQPQEPLGAVKADPRANGDVEYLTWFSGGGSPWVEAQVAGDEGCTCELICGPVCLSQTVLLSPESVKQSNSKCETQKNASMLVTVKLKGGNGKKGLLKLSSPDRRVQFGGLAVVGYGSHANPAIGGLYPIFDMACRERTLELPNVSCPATVEFLVCTDDDKDFDVLADWGGGAARCTKKVTVKKCLCVCFKATINAAWKTLVNCPQFVDFYQGIGIEQGPKIPGPTYEPDISVKCMESDEFEAIVGVQPQAYIDLTTMEIVLKCGNPTPEASILFELTNAASRHQHTEIDRKARDTKVSKEDFVRQHERIEWENLKLHHSIAQKCVAAGLWDKSLDRWASVIGPGGAFENFEDYLKVQKAASHPKVFEEWWDKNAKK